MNISTKLLKAAAGSAGGAGLDVDEVFSTFLYDGSSSAQTINNGIDLSGEGGLVWIKERSSSGSDNHLTDTVRGIKNPLNSDSTAAENTYYANNNQGITAFNNNGFTVASGSNFNDNGDTAVSWTFRKAPKFFDVVTYTGNGVQGRTISHNLDHLVGMLMIKCTSHSGDWSVQHRMLNPNKYLALNENHSAQTDGLRFHSTAAGTSTFSVGSGNAVNGSGRTYVAYLFAHHNTGNPGEFGPDSDQDIIKCGSYTGNGSSTGPEIDLGFEPQLIIIKKSSDSANWTIVDTIRGITQDGDHAYLQPNVSAQEYDGAYIRTLPTGFQPRSNSAQFNSSGSTYIYMAIRRGPLATPTDATKVFAMDLRDDTDAPMYKSGFVTDMSIYREVSASNDWYIQSRLTGVGHLHTHETASENTNFTSTKWDYMNGFYDAGSINSAYQAWMWKRAPGYFDVVAYQGTGSAGFTFNHNLGVKPEMIWVKNRGASEYWAVYHKDLNGGTNPSHYYLKLNDTNAEFDYNEIWNDTEPTATQVTVGQQGVVNSSSFSHIAYLFATAPGVSKVGSYTGDATSDRVIDCGFSNGARFVLIKDVDQSGTNWQVFDTARGLTSTKAELLRLNLTNAQIPNGSPTQDYHNLIEPDSSGFKLNNTSALQVNASGVNYIFYAIA